MKKTITSLAVVIALAAAPSSLALAHEVQNPMMQSSPQAEDQPFDVQFLDTMVKHHQNGIKMFQMAADKAQNPELKAMAQKMVDDQKKEIPQLKALREEVKPGAPEAINMKLMKMDGMKMDDMDMSKLKDLSGMEFDHQFLHMTVMHHQCAVDMSDVALKQSQNSDVKKKAQMMHDMQKEEISRMEKMLDSMGKS